MTKAEGSDSTGNFAGIGFSQLIGWASSKIALGLPLTIFVLFYPMVIGSLQQGFSGYELPLATWLWDLLVGIGAATVLILARVFKVQNRLVNNLVVWVFASVLSAVLPLLVSLPLGPIANYLIAGIPAAALSMFGLLVLFTLAWGAITDYQGSNRELLKIAAELEVRRENLNNELAKRQKSLADQILNEVEPRISHIQELLRSSNSKLAAGEILNLIDNLVRPLSQGLSVSTNAVPIEPVTIGKPSSLRSLSRRLTRKLGVTSIFTPHLHVIFAVSFFGSTMSLAAGINGVLYLAAFLLLQVLLYGMIRKVVGGFRLSHWMLLFANLLVAAVANLIFVFGSQVVGLADPEGLIAYVGLGIFLVFVAAGYVSIYSAAKQAANQEIRLATERLAYLVGELQIRTASLRKQFALDLHGDLQAKLQAALVRLERSTSSDSTVVEQVLSDLAGATEGIENPTSKPASIEQLRELPGLWDGICEVTINLDPASEAKLNSNQGLSAVAVEIVRERIINAVKHSSAEEIDVSISLEDSILVISSRNEDLEVGQKLDATTGGGSALLDEVCQSWKLSFDAGDVVFEARVTS
jgi:signal transduction histidine kinase